MALLDKLKEQNDENYISFWGLISNMINVDEERDDENYSSNETYITLAEALLRLKLHERIHYFMYDSDNFIFEQIDNPEVDQAKIFLNMLHQSNCVKLLPTEVIAIQSKFKNYFWLKKSLEQVLPKDTVNFTDPRFSHTGHQRLNLDEYYSNNNDIDEEKLIELQQQNQRLKERVCELEAGQGYLDLSNEHFSIEMKLCHDAWNHIYKKENNSHLPHGKQVSTYLKSHPNLPVNAKAIDRIKTVTNPKRTLASAGI